MMSKHPKKVSGKEDKEISLSGFINYNELEHLASFPKLNPNPIIEIDSYGLITYYNPATVKLLKELELKNDAHVFLPADILDVLEDIKKNKNNDCLSREIKINGRHFAANIFASAKLNTARIYLNEITSLVNQRLELEKLNKTLKALSDSNQAMIHAVNELQYLQEVCRIINEDCGHSLVWIGFAQNDRKKSVMPIAFAGFDNNYINSLKISWGNSARSKGPTGTTIKTGKISLCRDMKSSPNFKLWRKEALKRGYASSIALPLTYKNGKTFGSITIYSTTIDAFSESEINLLAKLAQDLSYGINSIRLREKHAKIEESLHRSEQRYRALFEKMTEGFALHEVIFDQNNNPIDFRFLEVNSTYEKLTGLKRKEILGKLKTQVMPHDDPKWIKLYGRVALSGKSMHFESYSATSQKYYEVFAYRPAPGQFALLFSDITQRKQSEKEKNNFIAIMSHELRNPLTPILTGAQLIKAQLVNTAHDQKQNLIEALNTIERQAKNMSLLLDDLLDISRISRGKIQLRKELIDINQSIVHAQEAVVTIINEQNQKLILKLPAEKNVVYADPIRLEQIIVNLLNNAVKYTPRGGTIEISAKNIDNRIEIRVKDNGIGIEAEKMNSIFDLFSRSSDPFVSTKGELGIGLKLTKDLVALHDGSITVKSSGKDQGSEFIVSLPAAFEKISAKIDSDKTKLNSVNGKPFILIVDDNKDIALTQQKLLSFYNYQTEICHSGKEAINLVKKLNPQIILLDIGLPDLDGYEVAKRIRSIENKKNKYKIIAISGYGQEEDKRKAFNAGFDYHLTKPVDFSVLEKYLN